MGGHDHGHGPAYEIPNPDIYKVEDVPHLKRVQEKLAEKGLKDPWLRNEVWRYTNVPGTPLSRAMKAIFRGARFGIPLFIVVVSIENYLGAGDHGHGHGDHH